MAFPHPPLGQDHGDEKYCAFHTETDVSADKQQKELLDALNNAGDGPWDDRPEHRGQFVGATFKAIDLSGETIAAEDHDVRFDHAVFRGEGNTSASIRRPSSRVETSPCRSTTLSSPPRAAT